MLGKEKLLKYEPRLSKVGCRQIKYIALKNHMPLSRKWVKIANIAEGESFALCASDDYSPPNRIQLSHEKLMEGYNWFDVEKTLFLNLVHFTTTTFIDPSEDKNSGVTMCTKTKFVKNLKGPPWPCSGVDNWLKKNGGGEPYYQHKGSLLGLETDCANKIFLDRREHYPDNNSRVRYVAPYHPPEQKLDKILPLSLINRLKKQFLEVNNVQNKIAE